MCDDDCAGLFGAAKIIAIEPDAYRLEVALKEGLCDVGINPANEDAEQRVGEITDGRARTVSLKRRARRDTFEMAWKIARPNAVVALVAMYEAQTLPLPNMYGKNLTFKTGGVDAVHCARLMKLIEAGG